VEKRKRNGRIAFIIVVSVAAVSLFLSDIFFFRDILLESDFLKQLLNNFLYAAIPCVPAVILRVKFGFNAVRWLAVAATAVGVLCCALHIFLPETVLNETVVLYEDASVIHYAYVNDWIFVFAQSVLTSSVPALYCVAFVGQRREIWAALTPSLMFFVSLYVRYILTNNIVQSLAFIFDESILVMIVFSAGFTLWALLLIFSTLIIYKYITRPKIKNNKKEKIV